MHCWVLVWAFHVAFARSEPSTCDCGNATDCFALAGCFDFQEGGSLQLIQTKLELQGGTAKAKNRHTEVRSGPWANVKLEQPMKLCLAMGFLVLAIAVAIPRIYGEEEEVKAVDATGCKVEGSKDSASRKELKAVNAIRIVAAIHVVLFHFGPIPLRQFNEWGSSWMSLFFALSGLGAAYSKMQGTAHVTRWLPDPRTLYRRWVRVYPVYFTGAAFVAAWRWFGPRSSAIDLRELFVELSMMPAPMKTLQGDIGRRFNQPDWFCTMLVVCWLLEESFFQLVQRCWCRGAWARAVLACLCSLAWMALLPSATFDLALTGRVPIHDLYLGLAWVFCYFCGVVLAFFLSDQSRTPTPVSRISASVAAALILATYLTTDLQIDKPAESVPALFGNGGLDHHFSRLIMLPLQCLLLYGLAMEHDPLAKLLAALPSWVHELSLGVYLLQFPVFWVMSRWEILATPHYLSTYFYTVRMSVFLPALFVAAALSRQCIEKPSSRILNSMFGQTC